MRNATQSKSIKAMAEEIQVDKTMAKDKMVVDSTQSDAPITQPAAPESSKACQETNAPLAPEITSVQTSALSPNLNVGQDASQPDASPAITSQSDNSQAVTAANSQAFASQDVASQEANSKSVTPKAAQAKGSQKHRTNAPAQVNSGFETSSLVRANERQILSSDRQYSFGGTQSFSLRQLWPLKAYNYVQRRHSATVKVGFKNKEAILELGVGSNMTTSIQYWAKAINVLDDDNNVTPFASQLFGTPEYPGLDPYLEKIDSIWLFHYFMCCVPSHFTAAWFLFNRFNHQYFDKALALEELQRFVLDEYNLGHIKQIISAKTLEKDLAVVIKSYAPLTHDVGILRKQIKRLDNNEELSDTPLRELNLMSSTVKETQFNVGSHANLSPYVFAFCLLDFFMRSQGRLVTMDFNKIAYAEGSVGRIFKLDEMALDEYLQQLESITHGTLFFTEQNGLRQLVCPVEHSARPALLEQFLKRIYNHAA